MSSLSDLTVDTDVNTEDKDVLGGGYIKESGVYPAVIEMAYIAKSANGATSVNLAFKIGDMTIEQTLWYASGDAKGNKTHYINKKTGEKAFLPGFNMANAISFLTLGKEIKDLDTEIKTINIWDNAANARVPTQAEIIMPLLGQKLTIGLQKCLVDKTVKNNNGVYVATGDTKEENELVKVFQDGTNLTISEAKDGKTSGAFMDKWAKKWTDQVRDKSTKVAGVSGSVTGAPPTPVGAAVTEPLFPGT